MSWKVFAKKKTVQCIWLSRDSNQQPALVDNVISFGFPKVEKFYGQIKGM